MATKRLMTLRQIQNEKFPRSRSWIFARMAKGEFPAPVVANGVGPNLWEEASIDQFVSAFVAKAKEATAQVGLSAGKRSDGATAARARRRADIAAA